MNHLTLLIRNIHNPRIGPSLDEFAKAFEEMQIFAIGVMYSGFDKFWLVLDSPNITTMQNLIELERICGLSQGKTNSMSLIMREMNKVLRD